MYDLYQYNSSFVQTFIHYDDIPWADAIHVQLIDKNVQELIDEKIINQCLNCVIVA